MEVPGWTGGREPLTSLHWNPGTECTVGNQGIHSKSKRLPKGCDTFQDRRELSLRGTGRSVCASTWSFLGLNVPSSWRGSKQRSRSCLCLCSPQQPRPGLDKTSSTRARSACLYHQALNCGLPVTNKNYRKYSLHSSLPVTWLFKQKLNQPFSEAKLDRRKERLVGWAAADSCSPSISQGPAKLRVSFILLHTTPEQTPGSSGAAGPPGPCSSENNPRTAENPAKALPSHGGFRVRTRPSQAALSLCPRAYRFPVSRALQSSATEAVSLSDIQSFFFSKGGI